MFSSGPWTLELVAVAAQAVGCEFFENGDSSPNLHGCDCTTLRGFNRVAGRATFI